MSTKLRRMPMGRLSKKEKSFLDAWSIDQSGIFVPPKGWLNGVFVWSGDYNEGNDSIAIVANEEDSRKMNVASLSVGVISNEEFWDVESKRDSTLEFIADQSTHVVYGGLKSAIRFLNNTRGLPDGTKLDIPRWQPQV